MLRGVRIREHVFVLRTWLERPGDGRTMRGRIDHVGSGRRRYFANFGDLCDFVTTTQSDVEPGEGLEPDEESK